MPEQIQGGVKPTTAARDFAETSRDDASTRRDKLGDNMKAIELHVGRGERRGSLTVFPIWQERSGGRAVVLVAA